MIMSEQFTTVESIVEDIVKNRLDETTIAYLTGEKQFEAMDDIGMSSETLGVMARGNFLRWVRNYYGLWQPGHPLTERWLNEGGNDIRDGVDFSKDHPDNVSGDVFEVLMKRLKA